MCPIMRPLDAGPAYTSGDRAMNAASEGRTIGTVKVAHNVTLGRRADQVGDQREMGGVP